MLTLLSCGAGTHLAAGTKHSEWHWGPRQQSHQDRAHGCGWHQGSHAQPHAFKKGFATEVSLAQESLWIQSKFMNVEFMLWVPGLGQPLRWAL